jgi:Na+/H+ antiporter NhaC
LGFQNLTVPTDGCSVFARSIKYQFYPIFLLFFVTAMAITHRDLGPMLFAERERWLLVLVGEMPKWTCNEKISRPEGDTPRRLYNMWIPTIVWIASICVTFGVINDPASATAEEDFMAAIIYTTMGVATLTQVFYMVQRKHVVQDEEEPEDPEETRETPGGQ